MKNYNLNVLSEALDLIQNSDTTDNTLGDVAIMLIEVLRNQEGRLMMLDQILTETRTSLDLNH